MLDEKLISYMKSKGWWFDDISQDYLEGLMLININVKSDFAEFYLHAEDGPSFIGIHGEIYQLCWHIKNTNYLIDKNYLLNAIGVPDSQVSLDSFEGEGGFFYNKIDDSVALYKLSEKGNFSTTKWSSFNDFLLWFFDV